MLRADESPIVWAAFFPQERKKFRSAEENQGSREKDNYTSSSPPPTTIWAFPSWVLVSAHAGRCVHPCTARCCQEGECLLPQQLPSVNIWYTAKAPLCRKWANHLWKKNKLLFKNIHHHKGLVFLSSDNPVPKAPGLPLNWRQKHIGGSLWGVICFVRLVHSFIFSLLHSTGCLTVKPRND